VRWCFGEVGSPSSFELCLCRPCGTRSLLNADPALTCWAICVPPSSRAGAHSASYAGSERTPCDVQRMRRATNDHRRFWRRPKACDQRRFLNPALKNLLRQIALGGIGNDRHHPLPCSEFLGDLQSCKNVRTAARTRQYALFGGEF